MSVSSRSQSWLTFATSLPPDLNILANNEVTYSCEFKNGKFKNLIIVSIYNCFRDTQEKCTATQTTFEEGTKTTAAV